MFCLFFLYTGSGESDAHCWAEATHAAEGFPRHLKLHRDCKAPASPAFLPSFLASYLCFLTWPSLDAVILTSPFASLHLLICFFLSVSPFSHSYNAAGSQNGTIVSPLTLPVLTSFTHFGSRALHSRWLHLLQLFRSDHKGQILRFCHVFENSGYVLFHIKQFRQEQLRATCCWKECSSQSCYSCDAGKIIRERKSKTA